MLGQKQGRTRTWCVGAAATVLAAGVVFSGCGGSSSSNASSSGGSGQTLEVRWAWELPNDTASSQQSTNAAQDIERASGNAISVKTYPAGSLFTEDELVNAVENHSIDLATFGLHTWGGTEPALTIDQVPFLFTRSGDEDQAVEDAFAAAHSKFGQDVNEILAKHNVLVVGWGLYGFDEDMVDSKHPIRVPSDLGGLKMRSNGPIASALFKRYGASSQSLDSSEVYTAMQRGTIDGAYSGLSSIVSRKWDEVGKYVLAIHSGLTYYPVFANLDWWKGLTSKQRNEISQAIRSTEKAEGQSVIKAYQKDLATVQQNGNQVVNPTGALRQQWRQATDFLHQTYEDLAGSSGQHLLNDLEAQGK